MTVWLSSTPVVVPLRVRAWPASAALITSSSAMALMVIVGASVSTVMSRVLAVEVLPAASVAVTDRVSGPSPIAVISASVSV